MANRVIKDSIWSSKSLAKLPIYYQDQWPRWLLLADDWGCFNADPEVIKGCAYPKRREKAQNILKIRQIFYNAGMLFIWTDEKEREWGFFVNWNGHQFCNASSVNEDGKYAKHRRKTPEPPENLLLQYLQEHTKSSDNLRQPPTSFNKVVNPNPKPIPNPKPNLNIISQNKNFAGIIPKDQRIKTGFYVGMKKKTQEYREKNALRMRASNTDVPLEIIKQLNLTKCSICNKKAGSKPIDYIDLHHIIPKSIGGVDIKENILICCRECHNIIEPKLRQFALDNLNKQISADDIKKFTLDLIEKMKIEKQREELQQEKRNITQDIQDLLGQFSKSSQEKIKVYIERNRLKNKSKVITEGRKLTLITELFNAKERCADEKLFEYALEMAINYDACNVGYVNAIIRNKKGVGKLK